ncbi:MAG: galactokinase [Anaerolineae bacterium]|jgi:galactokinase|nr:galactokinase [Anaerolineae bacterium]
MQEFQYHVIAPGRVNLLGEHVDYCNGPVLPVAIDKAMKVDFSPREDDRVTIKALDLDEEVCFSLSELSQKITCTGESLPAWAKYPAGVAAVLQQHGLQTMGMDAQFTSDIPIGAGLSSSAALEVAFAFAFQTLADWELDLMTLAQYCQQAENEYVGMNCGLMDQFASAHGVKDHALYFKINELTWEPVPLPKSVAIIIADSKVPHSLTESAYNNRRQATEEALRLLKTALPEINALVDVSPAEFEANKHLLSPEVAMRAAHVVYECDRMNQAIAALKANDIQQFGKLMFNTHASLRDLYEVSVPEIDLLVEIAKTLPGIYGARLTGGGFGGCTVNLVAADKAQAFAAELKKQYDAISPYQTDVYISKASQGVHLV